MSDCLILTDDVLYIWIRLVSDLQLTPVVHHALVDGRPLPITDGRQLCARCVGVYQEVVIEENQAPPDQLITKHDLDDDSGRGTEGWRRGAKD